MKRFHFKALIFSFFGIIILALFLLVILPKQSFSNQENRVLQDTPKLNTETVLNGSFMEESERYISDHFPLRNSWITVKAAVELAFGRIESNGIYYGKNGQLFPVFDEPDYQNIERKINYLNQWKESISQPVFFSLIPNSTCIQHNRLPSWVKADNQNNVINYSYSLFGDSAIDLYSPLKDHNTDYIFYHTDHHWTSLGAKIAYNTLKSTMLPQKALSDSYHATSVATDFYGTSFSASGYTWVRPDTVQTFVPDRGITVESYINGLNNAPEVSGLYHEEYLTQKDKYSYFLGGISPLIHIHNEEAPSSSLLLIRDSYSDSLAPFFTQDYSDIYLIDLRYYHNSIENFLSEHEINQVLILYSVSNFCDDNNLGLLLS